MAGKLRIGVLGLGRIGKIHADNIARFVPRAQLAAVSFVHPTDEKRAFAESLGLQRIYTDPLELVFSPDIDAVAICSSTDTHADLAIEAAAAGKHIFCEKPIALTIAKVMETLAAVEKSGVKFQVAFNQRFDHNFRAVKALSRAGKLGKITMLCLTSRDPAPPPISYIKSSGGIFADMMIHDFDMARFQLGDISEVYSNAYALDPAIGAAGDVDTAIVSLKFENGASGVIINSRTNACGYDQRIELFGTLGNASIGNDTGSTVKLCNNDGVTADAPLPFFLERYKQAYIDEMIEFCDAVIDDKPVPVTGRDGLENLRSALAATKSWKEGRPVKLSEIVSGT
jgi:myo-inositol 2-dehydrogenase/D-chiro-inositol 1-dehydrogenase